MQRVKPILYSIVWTIVILLFPVTSGIVATVLEMNQIHVFLTQGCFMLISLAIPIAYVYTKKISIKELGLKIATQGSMRKVLFFVPLVLAGVPLLLGGVDFYDFTYITTLAFFALAVGISEEIYFRGIILTLLNNSFSVKQTVIISALIFGIEHIASILAGESIISVLLQIINAVVFGIVATEIVLITKSLIPVIIWHIAFNFVNHITQVTGVNEIVAIGIQEVIMIIYAFYLWNNITLECAD